MDINAVLSITIIISGLYSILCFPAVTGKVLFPSLYLDDIDTRTLQRFSLLLTGVLMLVSGIYSLFITPVF